MIKHIASATNPLIKEIFRLKTIKGVKEQARFIVEGYHLVNAALASSKLETVILLEADETLPDYITQIVVPPQILNKLSQQKTPQGIIGVSKFIEQAPLTGRRMCYLDGVNDPGNLGTIIRAASAFGLELLLIGPQSASLYNPKTVAATQGALYTAHIKIAEPDDLKLLHEAGYRFVGTRLVDSAIPLHKYDYRDPLVVFFGSEAHGLSPDIINMLDDQIVIPMVDVESLNVAMAASIVIYDMKYR